MTKQKRARHPIRYDILVDEDKVKEHSSSDDETVEIEIQALEAHDSMKGYHTRENENDKFFSSKQDSPQGNTVLHVAARYGKDKLVKKVVQKEPKLLSAQNSNDDIPLHVAAKHGHVSTLKVLLAAHLQNLRLPFSDDSGPTDALDEILQRNRRGNTFFHEALSNKHEGVMMNLLEDSDLFEVGFRELLWRCVLFMTNYCDESLLYLAIEAGYKEFVDQALAKLDKPHPALDKLIKDYPLLESSNYRHYYYTANKSSPLIFAVILKRDQDILDIILRRKPEWIHLKDNEERTPLHYAASIGYFKGVESLLRSCASCVMKRDKYGYLPLHLASDGGHVEVVHKLLQHFPNPRETLDKSGRNILHLAVESGKYNVVRYILQAAKTNHELEKMINDKDAKGNTLLHLATLCCNPKIVHALTWDKRVDLASVNKWNQTALDACDEQFPLENPSLRERLTWIALKSAKVPCRKPPPSSIRVPPESTKSLWKQTKAPNKDQHKDNINTLMLVSTLIITVTFAAGFTMPGGTKNSDPRQGMAVMQKLLNGMWLNLFMLCITISMYGAIGVTIILIWAQLGLGDSVVALKVARPLLGITLAALSLAFLGGVHSVINDLSWLATIYMVMGVIFVLMLLLMYTVLCYPSCSSFPAVRYISYYPFLLLAMASLLEEETDETDGTSSPHGF